MQRSFALETLDKWLANRMVDVHTCMPCRVLAYDASAQTVDVRPQISHLIEVDGERTVETMADLYDVPVAFPRGGGFHISFPIAVDDYVLVIFSEEPTISWREKAREVEPGLRDRHGLNGAFALPMGYPDKDKLTDPSGTDLVISSDDGASAIVVKPGGEVLVGDDTATEGIPRDDRLQTELSRLKSELDAVKTDLSTLLTAISGAAVSPMDGGATLKTNIVAALAGWPAMSPANPGSTATDKVKGT